MAAPRPRPITPRYASLPLLSLVLRLVSLLIVGFSITFFLYAVKESFRLAPPTESLRMFLSMLSSYALSFFRYLLLALALRIVADLILVLLDIEENTRRTADAITGQISGTTPRLRDHD